MLASRWAVPFMLAVMIATPVTLHAQQSPRAPESAGPRLTATATAAHGSSASDAPARYASARQNVGKPVALMLVGGAAILLGAIIEGDAGAIFMVGGAIALLVGLYQYLQ
jgi:hypothetical protein